MAWLIQGANDPKQVGCYSRERLRDEMLRLAHNLSMTGMEYTAAILARAANGS